jgi:hypothetical protein
MPYAELATDPPTFLIFEDPEYARLYQESQRETAAYYLARKSMTAKEFRNDPEMQARMQRLQSLMDQLERPVNSVEKEPWRELTPGRGNGAGKQSEKMAH